MCSFLPPRVFVFSPFLKNINTSVFSFAKPLRGAYLCKGQIGRRGRVVGDSPDVVSDSCLPVFSTNRSENTVVITNGMYCSMPLLNIFRPMVNARWAVSSLNSLIVSFGHNT